MKTIQIGKKSFSVATSWEECPPDQLVVLLPLQLVDQPEDPGASALLKYAAAKVLLGAPEALLAKLDQAQRWRVMKLASWVFTTRIQAKPFPLFQFQGVNYILPDPGFVNTSAIEIALANVHYIAYSRKDQPSLASIYYLVATLCRPIRKDLTEFQASMEWNGDQREPFNSAFADQRAKAFQDGGLPIGPIMAILQYFEFTNNRFLDAYKTAYDPADDDGQAPLYPDGRGLITTFMDVAKTGAFGDFESVCRTPGHTVWMYLVDNNLKIRRANQRAEQAQERE